jgi:hypothetical protein
MQEEVPHVTMYVCVCVCVYICHNMLSQTMEIHEKSTSIVTDVIFMLKFKRETSQTEEPFTVFNSRGAV